MDDDGPSAGIFFFILLVLIDLFFYGFGAAVGALNSKEITRRAVEEKDKKSQKLTKFISRPGEYANTLQLIVTLINVLIGAIYLSVWHRAIDRFLTRLVRSELGWNNISLGVITTISTALTMVFLLYILLMLGVLLPKKIASRIPERWAYACITPVYLVTMVLSPFTGLVTASANLILRLFGVKSKEDENDVTEEEIINMVNEGHEQGVIQASEAEMISNIFEFGNKEVQDIMTYRNNVVAVDGNTRLDEALEFMLSEKNSRFPVYEENMDHIIGILHLKDAMRFRAKADRPDVSVKELKDLLREPYFVPQTKNIDELFKEMQFRKLQMAIVIDEYGQMDGLVAMEDILEEIVGNIMDEYDEDMEYIDDKGNDEYVIDGKTPLEELEEELGIQFEEEEFDTLNGFLISRMDKIPEENEEFDMDAYGYHFKILSVENKRIRSVLVTKLPEAKMGDPARE